MRKITIWSGCVRMASENKSKNRVKLVDGERFSLFLSLSRIPNVSHSNSTPCVSISKKSTNTNPAKALEQTPLPMLTKLWSSDARVVAYDLEDNLCTTGLTLVTLINSSHTFTFGSGNCDHLDTQSNWSLSLYPEKIVVDSTGSWSTLPTTTHNSVAGPDNITD